MPVFERSQPDRVPSRIVQGTEDFSFTSKDLPGDGNNVDSGGGTFMVDWMGIDQPGQTTNVEPPPDAFGTVTITISARAKLGPRRIEESQRWIEIGINQQTPLSKKFFLESGTDCNPIFDTDSVTLTAQRWNDLKSGGFNGGQAEGVVLLRLFAFNIPADPIEVATCETGGQSLARIIIQYNAVAGEPTVEELDLLLWGEDLCQNILFQPFIRPESIESTAGPEFERGMFEVVSTPCRAVWDRLPKAEEEPCQHLMAGLAVDVDGFARVLFCSQPATQRSEELQYHLADLTIATEQNTLDGLVEPGTVFWMGVYKAPFWTEAILNSSQLYCRALIGDP